MAADWYEHGGGHTTWTCRTCDQTVYGPPLNVRIKAGGQTLTAADRYLTISAKR